MCPGTPGTAAVSEMLGSRAASGHNGVPMPLSDREREILDFERSAFMIRGPKESAIRAELGISSTRYYEVLGELVDRADAYEYDPLLVRRLWYRRRGRRRRRVGGREVDPNRK